MTQAAHILRIVPRDYDIFAGLDVDKKSMAVTFTDHGTSWVVSPSMVPTAPGQRVKTNRLDGNKLSEGRARID